MVSRAEMEKAVRDWYAANGFQSDKTLRGILRHGLERIYDQVMTAGRVTVSGRLRGRGPNLQQIRRKSPEGQAVIGAVGRMLQGGYRSMRDRA